MSRANQELKRQIECGASLAEIFALIECMSRTGSSSAFFNGEMYADRTNEKDDKMIDILAVANPKSIASREVLYDAIKKATLNEEGVFVYYSEKADDVLLRIKVQDREEFIKIIVRVFAECRLSQEESLLDGIDIHPLGNHTPAQEFTHQMLRQTHVE